MGLQNIAEEINFAPERSDGDPDEDEIYFTNFIKSEIGLFADYLSKKQQEQISLLLNHADEISKYIFEVHSTIFPKIDRKGKALFILPSIGISDTIATYNGGEQDSWIYINIIPLLDIAELWDSDKYYAKSKIKSFISHEISHEYIKQNYPKTDLKSIVANRIKKQDPRRYFEYPLDRGEIACYLFEIEILLKAGEEDTSQREADKKLAKEIYQNLLDDINQGRKDKKWWRREQWTRMLLSKFPNARLFLQAADKFIP